MTLNVHYLTIEKKNSQTCQGESISKDHESGVQFVVLDQCDSSAWYNRGAILEGIGKQDMALGSYNRALEINPDHLFALINKGYALNSLGRYDEALDFFEQAIDIDLSDPVIFRGQGSSFFNLGRYAKALSSYIQSTELDSADAAAWNGMGAS
jgi:tetratricopeptide (TPR) repeat protein